MKTKLYLCDGQACTESNKECCFYENNGECIHTIDKNHAISTKISGFPHTYFKPLGDTGILIESISERDLIKLIIDKKVVIFD